MSLINYCIQKASFVHRTRYRSATKSCMDASTKTGFDDIIDLKSFEIILRQIFDRIILKPDAIRLLLLLPFVQADACNHSRHHRASIFILTLICKCLRPENNMYIRKKEVITKSARNCQKIITFVFAAGYQAHKPQRCASHLLLSMEDSRDASGSKMKPKIFGQINTAGQ